MFEERINNELNIISTRKRNLRMKDICASSLDSHPNAYGHELIAEGFYDYLMDHKELLKKKYIH